MSATHRRGVTAGRGMTRVGRRERGRRCDMLCVPPLALAPCVCGGGCASQVLCVEDDRNRTHDRFCCLPCDAVRAPEGSILSRRCYTLLFIRLVHSLPSQSWAGHISVATIWVLQLECHAVGPSSSWAAERKW